MQEIQFIEVSRTKRKFGVSIEHNTSDIAQFCGVPISFPSLPGKEKHGDVVARIPTTCGYVSAAVGDWVCKDSKGNLYVRKG